MKLSTCACLLALLAPLSPLHAKDLPIVPYPHNISVPSTAPFLLKDGVTIKASQSFADAADLLLEDIDKLYGVKARQSKDKAQITLQQDTSMANEAYELSVKEDGIVLKAANYNTIVMGLSTLLQIVNDKDHSIPACQIADQPSHGYRCFMLDVARRWVELGTIKNIVDLCRWYKVPYLQIHLSDDQLYTLESKLYPDLTKGKKHYTQEQMKEVVAYAQKRGVIIIPELDLPGHSSAMRRQMPDLFGGSWSIVDIVNPQTVQALKDIISEMMGVFYTSPYFHIGADEVWLGKYQTLDHVKKYLAENKDKVDGMHDVFLAFIVQMHEHVKACGKKTIVWESFPGKGSKKVPIPNDLLVLGWNTLFQSPGSLVKNDYQIVNSTFKPCYITPGRRWTPEYIYKWNVRRWERFNEWAGRAHSKPIQLDSNKNLNGAQMCAWEMIDYDNLISVNTRVPAFSENVWNDENKQSYEEYLPRAEEADAKIMDLIFPAEEERSGFNAPCPYEMDNNRVNHFRVEGSVFFKPFNPTDSVYFTTDDSVPTTASTKMTEPLKLTKTTIVKYVIFDKDGKAKGYKSIKYRLRPLEIVSEGFLPDFDPTIFRNVMRRCLKEESTVTITNHYPNSTLHYTLDRTRPTLKSPVYTEPIKINSTIRLHAAALDEKGKIIGDMYYAEYKKLDKNDKVIE